MVCFLLACLSLAPVCQAPRLFPLACLGFVALSRELLRSCFLQQEPEGGVAVLRRFGLPNVSYGEDYAIALRLSRDYEIGRIYDSLYLCRRWSGNTDSALPLATATTCLTPIGSSTSASGTSVASRSAS